MSKRKFKVGDKVVIKGESVYGPKGVVGTVVSYFDKKYTVKFVNGFTHSFRGVELDAYVEPKVEPKKAVRKTKQVHRGQYEVGDRVTVKETNIKDKTFENKVGTIVAIEETGDGYPYKVEIEGGRKQWCCVKGHAKGEPKKEVKEHNFKVGDRIEYKHDDGETYKGAIVEVDTGLGGGLCLCRLENFVGHNGESFSKKSDGYGTNDHWFCIPHELKKIEEHKEEEPKNTIVIYQKDRDVVALDKVTGKKCYAHCHPDDKFDFTTGAKIAFGRLIGEPSEEEVIKEEPIKYIDRFEKGKTYIFDKEIFKSYSSTKVTPHWVDECDGKVVEDATGIVGRIGRYLIGCSWCKEVTPKTATTKEANSEVDVFFEALKHLLD